MKHLYLHNNRICYNSILCLGWLNDLWKFDGYIWTWISGSNQTYQVGVYGIQGVSSSINIPGARSSLVSWIDSNNNLWLFGGLGYDGLGSSGKQ